MKSIALLLGLILLSGCGTTPEQRRGSADPLPMTQTGAALFDRAQQAQEPERSQLLVNAAEQFLRQNQAADALSALRQANRARLSLPQEEQFIMLGAQASLTLGLGARALDFLKDAKAPLFLTANLEVQQQLSELRARAYLLKGDALLSAMERVFAAGLYTGDAYWHNHEQIWSTLTQVPNAELLAAQAETPEPDLKGWVDLALRMRQQPASLDDQLQALREWQQANIGHPAARRLPEELQLLSAVHQRRPQHIALTLPLSGPLAAASSAIRDGFLAAYYADPYRTEQGIEIEIFDTSRYPSYLDLYQTLAGQPFDLVVGPLDKNAVAQLEYLEQLAIPVLALNYTDSGASPGKPLYQFGLAIEDEITQTVEHAWNSGYRHAVIIVPESSAGQRAQQAFATNWQERGGNIMNNLYLHPQEDFSAAIRDLLAVRESEQRSQEIAQTIGEPVKSEPRRRQDIDVIFLATPPIIARQIKPLLAYHYGADIPVYGTSQIFGGQVNVERDQDLNGIRFLDLPWVLRKDLPLKQETLEVWPAQASDRLYALGIDAYRVAPRLDLMRQFQHSTLQGMTGDLRLGSDQKVRRRLDWAQFRSGRPRAFNDAGVSAP